MDLTMKADDFVNKGGDFPKDPNIFFPNMKKTPNGVYQAVGRFLPWHKDATNSKYRKYSVSLKNPASNDRIRVDCPSTITKKSILRDLDNILRERKKINENDQVASLIQKNFSRYVNFTSLFYIYTNPIEPDLQGRLMVYQYGTTIEKMLMGLIRPAGNEMLQNQIQQVSVNPFDAVHGRDFVLHAARKTAKYNTYDSSYFLPQESAFHFGVQNTDSTVIDYPITDEEMVKISQGEDTIFSQFLINNSPNLEDYFYKEWTDTTRFEVSNYLKIILAQFPAIMEQLLSITFDVEMKEYMSQNLNTAGMGMYSPGIVQQTIEQPVAPIAPVQPLAQQPVAPIAPVQPLAQQPVAPTAPVQPFVQQPVVPAPVVTAPVVTAPVVTAPVVTAPVVTAPVVTAPVVTAPIVTAPVVTTPIVTVPVVTEPVVTAPVVPTPIATAPVVPVVPVVPVPVVPAPIATAPVVPVATAPVVDNVLTTASQQPHVIPTTPTTPENPAPPINLGTDTKAVEGIQKQNEADFQNLLKKL